MSNIIVVVEAINGSIKKSAQEAVTYGHELAGQLGIQCVALVMGECDKAASLGIHGANAVIHINKTVSIADNQTLTRSIADIAKQKDAKAIVLAHNSTSRSLAGRLSIRLDSGCISSATGLPSINGDTFEFERSVYAGKAKAKVSVSGSCKIISMTAGAVGIKSDGSEVGVEILDFQSSNRVKSIETKRMTGKTPLPEADLVVSAGRGLKDAANWGIVEELADVIGATTACSRPVADAGWRPHHEHVGQTGIAIKPKLYIALGISGAIQHLAGVNNSKVIVVINKDPEAPFFKAADYGIVGDVFEVVPKLTQAIKAIKAQH